MKLSIIKKVFVFTAIMLLVVGSAAPAMAVPPDMSKAAATATLAGPGSIAALLLLINFGTGGLTNSSKENPGGLQTIGYLALVDDLTAFPALSLNPTTNTLASTLTGVYTPVTGKGFIPVYSTQKKTSYSNDGSGEPDTSGVEGKIKFFIAGVDEDTIAFTRRVRSGKSIYIGLLRDGKRRVYGEQGFACWCSGFTETSGESIKDLRGAEIELTYEGLVIPLFTGAIPLYGGTTVPAVS